MFFFMVEFYAEKVCEQMIMKVGQSPFVLIVEPFNQKTGVRPRVHKMCVSFY